MFAQVRLANTSWRDAKSWAVQASDLFVGAGHDAISVVAQRVRPAVFVPGVTERAVVDDEEVVPGPVLGGRGGEPIGHAQLAVANPIETNRTTRLPIRPAGVLHVARFPIITTYTPEAPRTFQLPAIPAERTGPAG